MSLPTIGNVDRPRSMGYGCRINNDYYRLFVTPETPMNRDNAELQAPRIDDQSTPESISQDFGVSFSRTDFSGGEGLRLAHSPTNPDNANSMFWDSRGVEAHHHDQTERRSLELLKDVDSIDVHADDNLHLALDRVTVRLYLSAGEDIRFTDNPYASTPTYTTENPHAGDGAVDVRDIAFFGGELFVALGSSGLHKRDSTGTYSDITDDGDTEWDSTNVLKVWNVKQRIIFGNNNQLWEVVDTNTGDSSLRLTIEAGFTFNDAFDIGSSILITATDGYIYSLSLDEDTAQLVVSGRFSIAGEVPSSITGLDALTLLTTYQPTANGGYIGRVWLLSVQEGQLLNRQIIREFGTSDTSDDNRILASITQRNHAFVGVDEGNQTHLWHYDYATTGIFRHMGSDVNTGQIVDMVTIGEKVFWTVAGQGLMRQSDDNVSFGYLISPLADNFTRDIKSWSGLMVDAENIGGPSKLSMFYSTDPAAIYSPVHPSWKKWVDIVSVSQAGVPFPIGGVAARFITIKIELNGDNNDSPNINSFTVLSSPGESDVIYELPINVSDVVTRPFHQYKTIPGLGRKIHGRLKAVQGTSVFLEILDPVESIQGTVMRISEPVVHYPKRGSPIFIAQVVIRGRRVPQAGIEGSSSSPASAGIGMLGVMKIGGVE